MAKWPIHKTSSGGESALGMLDDILQSGDGNERGINGQVGLTTPKHIVHKAEDDNDDFISRGEKRQKRVTCSTGCNISVLGGRR